jgi:hypothetical protein
MIIRRYFIINTYFIHIKYIYFIKNKKTDHHKINIYKILQKYSQKYQY